MVALAVVMAGEPAGGATGQNLPAGSTVCTDLSRSDVGVWIYGYDRGTSRTWTVRRSSTMGGPETEVFRATTSEVPTSTIAASAPGTSFYRACLTVNRNSAGYRLRIGGNRGWRDAQVGIGPHTATLGPGGRACGEFVFRGTARIVCSSNVPVRFSIGGQGEDDNSVPDAWRRAPTPAIDQPVTVPLVSTEACVMNVSTTTAMVAFDLLPPGGSGRMVTPDGEPER